MVAQEFGEYVVPLLCQELLKRSQPFQLLHLETFERNLSTLWRCLIFVSHAELLLAVLFKILSRRSGSTSFEVTQNVVVGTQALRVLHRLFTDQHPHFKVFLTALTNLLTRMGLTDDFFYRRPTMLKGAALEDGVRRQKTSPQPNVDGSLGELQLLQGRQSLATPGSAEPVPDAKVVSDDNEPTEEQGSAAEGRRATPPAHLDQSTDEVDFWDPLSSSPTLKGLGLHPNLTDLTVEQLTLLKATFDEIDTDGSAELSFNELMDFSAAAGIKFSMHIFKRLDTDGKGRISFIEILHTWFPKVSQRNLKRNVALLPSATEMRRSLEKRKLAQEQAAGQKAKPKAVPTLSPSHFQDVTAWQDELDARRREDILRKDDERESRWGQYCHTTRRKLLQGASADPAPQPITVGAVQLSPADLFLDAYVDTAETRALAVDLLTAWDLSSLNVCFFLEKPTIHLYLPQPFSRRVRVFRDFATCGPRPPTGVPWKGLQAVHVKTNIPQKSDIMYRLLVEGYNYGVNAPIHSDIVGYTHRRWNKLGKMEDFGWPEGWDQNTSNDYANGAQISQYFSKDGFVVVRLLAKSMFNASFSVSAYILSHDYGADFWVGAEFFFTENDI
mmetsp:Transcript_52628/g.93919  ORF Transcript_52628/g.93919 Transcript_52628/m.93919 type:complete len:613 (-) Transcript_52628:709-2547(-)